MRKLFAALTVCTCGFSTIANADDSGSWYLLVVHYKADSGTLHKAVFNGTGYTHAGCLVQLGEARSSITEDNGLACVYMPDMK